MSIKLASYFKKIINEELDFNFKKLEGRYLYYTQQGDTGGSRSSGMIVDISKQNDNRYTITISNAYNNGKNFPITIPENGIQSLMNTKSYEYESNGVLVQMWF